MNESKIKDIYIDTNFLLIPIQFKVDIFREIERICIFPKKINILSNSIDELNNIINKQKGKSKDAAKIAIQIIEKMEKQKSLNITTFSKELKHRIQEHGSKIIILKSKGYLELI